MRISVGPGTPELYEELLALEDSARCERIKHLASLALLYFSRGQAPLREVQAVDSSATAAPSNPDNNLTGVVRRLRMSLDDDSPEIDVQ